MGPYSATTPDSMKTIISNFKKAEPAVSVNFQTAPWTNYDQIITTQAQAGKPPGLAMDFTFGAYKADGLLRPVDDWVSPQVKSDLLPAFLATGQGVATPDLASVRGSFLNSSMLSAAGIAGPPQTLDELQADLVALKKANPKVTPMGFVSTTDDVAPSFSYYLFGFGGKWIDDSGQFLINSPQSVQALTFIKSLYDQKLIEQDVTANRGTQENRFMAGQTAIMPDGNFLVNTLKTQAPTLKYQIGPLPHAAGVAPFAVGVCDYFIAFNTKDAAQSAAATDLANFIYQPANYVPWLVNDGFLPVTSSAVEAYKAAAPEMAPFLENLPSAKFYPSGDSRWAKVNALMVTTVQSVLLGKVGVKAGLDAAEKQIDALPKG